MSRSPSLVFDSRQLSEGCQCQHHHKSHSTLSLLFAPSPTKTIQRISRSRLPTLSVVICLFALLADAAALPRSSPAGRGSTRVTPVGSADGSGSRKRRMVEHETSATSTSRRDVSSSEAEYISVASGKGSVEVLEVDSDGRYVALCNISDKDLSLGGWSLKQSESGKEVSYKFPRTVNLKSRQTVKIWSPDREHLSLHAPADLSMKSGSWIAGENQKTVLVDSKGEEVACRELRRTVRTASPISDDLSTDDRGMSHSSTWKLSSIFSILM